MQKVNLKHGQISASKETAILPSIYHNIYRVCNTPLADYFTALDIITKTCKTEDIITIFRQDSQTQTK